MFLGGACWASELPAAEIPFRLHDHCIVVKGSIGPLEGLNLVIDTGASLTTVSREIGERLKLKGNMKYARVYGSRIQVQSVTLPHLTLGSLAFFDVPARVLQVPLGHMRRSLRIDALIGLDLLMGTNLTIDFEAQTLRFGPIVHAAEYVPVYLGHPFLSLRFEAGGKPLRLQLDTAAPDIILFAHRVEGRLRLDQTWEKKGIPSSSGKADAGEGSHSGSHPGNPLLGESRGLYPEGTPPGRGAADQQPFEVSRPTSTSFGDHYKPGRAKNNILFLRTALRIHAHSRHRAEGAVQFRGELADHLDSRRILRRIVERLSQFAQGLRVASSGHEYPSEIQVREVSGLVPLGIHGTAEPALGLIDVPLLHQVNSDVVVRIAELRIQLDGNLAVRDGFLHLTLEAQHPAQISVGIRCGVCRDREFLYRILGTGCEEVLHHAGADQDVVAGRWKGGRLGTLRALKRYGRGFGGALFGSKGAAAVPERTGNYYPSMYSELLRRIIEFYRNGKSPVNPEETLEIMAFMQAAYESRKSGKPFKLADLG